MRPSLSGHTWYVPDESLFDPERTGSKGLDFSDPDVVRAYLYHPTTQALAEDRGRRFRELRTAQQRATLDEALRARRADHQQMSRQLDALGPEDPDRAGLQRVLEAFETIIEALTLRLYELGDV